MSEADRSRPTVAHAVLIDAARVLRARLRAQRRIVDPNLDELAGQRRGKTAGRQLQLITDAMVEAFGSVGAKAQFAEMGARIIDAKRAG